MSCDIVCESCKFAARARNAAATAGAWWLLGVGAMLSLAGVRLFWEGNLAGGEKGCAD